MLYLVPQLFCHKIDVVLNTIYVLLQISSGKLGLLPKNMKIGPRIKSYYKNKKGV